MTWLRRRDGDRRGRRHRRSTPGSTTSSPARSSPTPRRRRAFLLLDLERVEWSEEACALFGLDAGRAARDPRLRRAGRRDDRVRRRRCRSPGSPSTSRRRSSPSPASRAGEAKCTYGTGAFILANGRRRRRRARRRGWRRASRGGSAARRRTASTARSTPRAPRSRGCSELEPHRRARPTSTASDGAAGRRRRRVFVPSLAGLGAPFWAPEARGGWVGLSLATRARRPRPRGRRTGSPRRSRRSAARSATTSAARSSACASTAGSSRSAVLMQAQADLLQVPVERYPSADATALGVAAFARLGAGARRHARRGRRRLDARRRRSSRGWAPTRPRTRLARWRAAAAALAGLAG